MAVAFILRLFWDLVRQMGSARTLPSAELTAERRIFMSDLKRRLDQERGLEKYGVECGCPKGTPDPGHLVKTASGDEKCDVCGRIYPSKTAQSETPSKPS